MFAVPANKQIMRKGEGAFTLLELIITLTVLAVMVLGALPLAQNAVKREREMRLRETLRMVRNAVDEFKRDAVGACPAGSVNTNVTIPQAPDPRSRVVIDDCTIFTNDNLDRYPPSLDVLVDGVKVRQRGMNLVGGGGLGGNNTNATETNADTEVKKVYLREMPVDPTTGKSDWKLRSSYQDKDSDSWDEINLFDIRSSSDAEALNGEKYSDW
jgi:general secretion pathway protein G